MPSAPRQNGDRRVALGEPLFLAEARYVQHELKKLGVLARVESDPSLGGRRDPIHLLFVSPADVKTAELVRARLLVEADPDDAAREASDPRPGRPGKGPLVLGLLGLVTGLRVGTRAMGSVWLGVVLAALLATVAFWGARLLSRSSRK